MRVRSPIYIAPLRNSLDGGRLVFLGWEAVSRKRVNERIEQTVHMVGVLMLLALIIVISFKNDFHIGSWFHK